MVRKEGVSVYALWTREFYIFYIQFSGYEADVTYSVKACYTILRNLDFEIEFNFSSARDFNAEISYFKACLNIISSSYRLTKAKQVHATLYLVTVSPLLGLNELKVISLLQEM